MELNFFIWLFLTIAVTAYAWLVIVRWAKKKDLKKQIFKHSVTLWGQDCECNFNNGIHIWRVRDCFWHCGVCPNAKTKKEARRKGNPLKKFNED